MTESPGTTSGQGTAQVAKEQAGQVGQSATQAAGQVAQTTKEQVLEVASEAKSQARDLLGEARTQVSDQAGSQRDKLVEAIRSLAEELESMASGGGGKGGMASEFARQASTRAHDVAVFLEDKEPGDLLHEVRSFARQRSGSFLMGAAALGVLAGRLTKGARATSSDSPSTGGSLPVPSTTTTATNPYADTSTYASGAGGGYQSPYATGDQVDVTSTHGIDAEGTRDPLTGPLATGTGYGDEDRTSGTQGWS